VALVFVLFVAFLVVLFLFLLPILFSLQAVGSLFVYPRQLRAMFGNRILRRNHALEHATIVVMMEREPGRRLNGFSTGDGFFVQGVRSTGEVDSAAREALRRLRAGERGLAIHRNCGTTIVAANMLAAVFFLGALGLGLYLGGSYLYLLILGGVLLALALRVPLSLLLQRYVTTDADLKDADGKLFIREVLRIAQERGKGWVDYQWRNPVSKQVEPKSTYFERAEDLIVLCGIYRTDNASAPRVLPAPHHATPLLR